MLFNYSARRRTEIVTLNIILKMNNGLPFLAFFERLKEELKFNLGPSEYFDFYYLLLQLDVSSSQEIYLLVKQLWLQDISTEKRFLELFDSYWGSLKENYQKSIAKEANDVTNNHPFESHPSRVSEKNTERKTKSSEKEKKDIDRTENKETPLPPKQDNREDSKDIWVTWNETPNPNVKTKNQPANPKILDHNFILSPKFWSISSRRLAKMGKLSVNKTRRFDQRGIDIATTVSRIAKNNGLVESPIYLQKEKQTNEKVYFVTDRSNSMNVYQDIGTYVNKYLFNSIDSSVIENLYFNESPKSYLLSEKLGKSILLDKWIRSLTSDSQIFIFSNVSKRMNKQDVVQIESFLLKILSKTKKVVWLNPQKEAYWHDGAAVYLSLMVPMVSASDSGLMNLISVIKKW